MRLDSVNKKNMVGYIAIFLVLTISSYWLYEQMRLVHKKNAVLVTETLPTQALTQQVIKTLNAIHLDAFALYGTTINSSEFNKQFKIRRVALSDDIKKLKHFSDIDQIQTQGDHFLSSISSLQKTMGQTSVSWNKAREELSDIKQSADLLLASVKQIDDKISDEAQQRALEIDQQIKTIQLSVPTFLIIVSVIIGGAYFLSRLAIAKPVITLARKLDMIAAEKDLRKDILVNTNDEVGMAAKSVNVLISSFRESSLEIRDAATTLLSSVEQLQRSASQGDQNVDRLSTQLAHLLHSISTLEDSIGQNEQRSQSASESALSRAQEVKTGAENVRKTSSSIVSLSENIERSRGKLIELQNSGNQVSSVVKAIADIAEQTNLLALNAAIEAARAGESGRGFAVVADEVRTLASRTHDSTHEINTILESIVSAISETVEQMASNSENASTTVTFAEETVVSLSAIEQSVNELSEENQHLSELAKVTKNDASAMRTVLDQIKNIADSVTESSKETRESATQMTELSSRLDMVSSKFKSRN